MPKKNFDYLRRELLHSYGFEHMATLINLEKAGLVKKQESKSNWLAVKRGLNLVMEGMFQDERQSQAEVMSLNNRTKIISFVKTSAPAMVTGKLKRLRNKLQSS